MIDSADVSDLQLEDVEDYTTDYPPAGFPHADENIHTASVSHENRSKSYRRNKFMHLVRKNKWTVALAFVLAVVVVAVLVSASAAKKESKNASANSGAAVVPDGNGAYEAPIVVDPKTVNQKAKDELLTSFIPAYDRHGMDSSVLTVDDTPESKALNWLASDDTPAIETFDHTQKMQRFAMATFYYATNAVPNQYESNPKPWVSAHLWLSDAHVCEWQGIVCNEQHHVETIALEKNNLSGSLPQELAILGGTLYTLDLTSNLIYMEGDMFDLFSKMTQLETLLLDDNYLLYDYGLPSQFGYLEKIKKLRLSYNLFSGQLESKHLVLQQMTQLTHLEIESNFLSGSMPSVIGELSNLVYIYMRRNEMSYNLDFLKTGKLKDLFAIWLDNNDVFGTIPTEIGHLTELASVSITNATLTGTIPTELGNLSGLRRLWLYSNKLSGDIPSTLANCAELEVFEVHDNALTGTMPKGICTSIQGSQYEYSALTCDCKSEMTCDKSCCTACY